MRQSHCCTCAGGGGLSDTIKQLKNNWVKHWQVLAWYNVWHPNESIHNNKSQNLARKRHLCFQTALEVVIHSSKHTCRECGHRHHIFLHRARNLDHASATILQWRCKGMDRHSSCLYPNIYQRQPSNNNTTIDVVYECMRDIRSFRFWHFFFWHGLESSLGLGP